MDDRVFVVFNPFSGKGRGQRLVEPVLAALRAGGPVEHALTVKAGDEETLALRAIEAGFRRIVAVGGDGTWSNVGNGILKSGHDDVALGLVAGGTGCDLAKSLGIPAQNVAAAARVVRAGAVRRIDVGRIEDRHFLNIAGFGFDIAVIEDSRTVRWLKGDLLYVYCALRQLRRFAGFDVEIQVDGGPPSRSKLLMLVLANARVFGGGFQVAPAADLEDGLLDGVVFANMPPLRRLAVMAALLRGRHAAAPEVTLSRGARFRLRFDAPPTYETDGEWRRAKTNELIVETRPRALDVLVPA